MPYFNVKTYCVLFVFFFGTTDCFMAQVKVDFPVRQEALENKNLLPDLNGLWEGEISQLNWRGQPAFENVSGKMHVEITQKGSKVKGLLVCRAKFAQQKGYLSYEKTFVGHWDGSLLKYEDVKIENYINTHRELGHIESCMKVADLDFYQFNNTMHLEGNWTGLGHISDVPCSPGKIHLQKVTEAEIESEVALTYNVNFAQKNKGPVELKWGENNKIKKIKNRSVKKGEVIEVKSTAIRITVYDHQKDDGDIISLNYNGAYVLERYTLKNEQHKIDVLLNEAAAIPNYLLLYAHNLGAVSPNTVAVIVDDGHTRQRFILNADMNSSDVIYFDLKK